MPSRNSKTMRMVGSARSQITPASKDDNGQKYIVNAEQGGITRTVHFCDTNFRELALEYLALADCSQVIVTKRTLGQVGDVVMRQRKGEEDQIPKRGRK